MKRIFLLILIGCFCTSVFAQRTITGVVRDASDNMSTLPGVSIQVSGTNRGVITDFDGNFTITVQPEDRNLVFSFLGMKSQTVAIGNKTTIDVVMDVDATVLDEVVISALNIPRDARSLSVAQQRVDAGTIAEVRDANIVSSLAGKVAGVQVTPPTSATGSARIVIRGNSSLTGNNQPLWVVDGMQIDNNDGSQSVHTGGGLDLGNGAALINPDDIESIDILKGPNAAALYGSRAANGVIIITTKKAKDGRFRVSAGTNTMWRYISQWPDFQNSFGVGHMSQMVGGSMNDRMETVDPDGNLYPYPGMPTMTKMLRSNRRSNGGPLLGQQYIGLDGLMKTYSPEPDNVYGFYQTAYTNTNNIAVEGGNADNNYRVSFTNMNANDVIERQNLVTRNTLNLRFFNTLLKGLTLDSKVNMVDDHTENRRYANQSGWNPLYLYVNFPRNLTLDQFIPWKDDNGKEIGRLDGHNPYWIINETTNSDKRFNVTANFDLSYQILPTLRANLKYGRQYHTSRRYEFRNWGADGDLFGYYGTRTNVTDNNTYEGTLVFNDRFGDFSLVAMIGSARNNWWDYWTSKEISQLKQPGFIHISNTDLEGVRADEAGYRLDVPRKRINSIFASSSLGFRDYAYLDLTARNDWSSTLPEANNSYFYPSVGVSLIPTEMFKVPSRVMYGKLRASFAQVGNDTNPYNLKNYYSFGGDNVFNGVRYASISGTLANSYLKPEITKSYEIGTDLRFLNGRINADITYYRSNSTDQIVQSQMAASSGYGSAWYNAGEIQNDGWEAALRFIPVETKNFVWEADINFTKNNSMVLSMVPGLDRINLANIFSLNSVAEVGLPYGAVFGTQWLRDQQGRRMVQQSNGEPVRRENSYLGNFNPDFMLGLSNRFRFKDFDLYVLLDMKKGGKLYSGTRRQAIRNGNISGLERQHESYWRGEVIFGSNQWAGVTFEEGNGDNHIINENIYYYDPARYDNMDDMNVFKIQQNPQTGQWEKIQAEDEFGNLLFTEQKKNSDGEFVFDANGHPVWDPSSDPVYVPDPNYVPEQCLRYFWPGNVGYYSDGLDDLITYDSSFVKLREISIGYNLPKALIAKVKMTNARVSVVGRNLWILYQKTPRGLDPEAALNAGNGQGLESGSLPPSTTFGFDVKISF
jgi:TonB-linked SusC/RagA family outer membrane protein